MGGTDEDGLACGAQGREEQVPQTERRGGGGPAQSQPADQADRPAQAAMGTLPDPAGLPPPVPSPARNHGQRAHRLIGELGFKGLLEATGAGDGHARLATITGVPLPSFLAACSAAASCGRRSRASLPLPVSTSTCSAGDREPVGGGERLDRLPLRLEPEPAPALLRRAHPQIRHRRLHRRLRRCR